ncbi:MAG: hypothetical protein ACK5NT_05215 [Pyrinomonadaceae bacterium]
MFRKLVNVNSIILIGSGLALGAWGVWSLYRYRDYTFGGGIGLIGIGNIMFGATNGFADQTPPGRIMFRVGVFSYLIGLLATVYSIRYLF